MLFFFFFLFLFFFSGFTVLRHHHFFSIHTSLGTSIAVLSRGSQVPHTVTIAAVSLFRVFFVMPLSSECSFTALNMNCLTEFLAGFLFLMCLKKDLSLVFPSCSSDFFVLFCLPCCVFTFSLPVLMIYSAIFFYLGMTSAFFFFLRITSLLHCCFNCSGFLFSFQVLLNRNTYLSCLSGLITFSHLHSACKDFKFFIWPFWVLLKSFLSSRACIVKPGATKDLFFAFTAPAGKLLHAGLVQNLEAEESLYI